MNWALLMKLTLKSILNRKFTSGLTLFSICISVFLLLSVDTVRKEAKHSFTNTISGTDLLVGARSGSVQLLLYSVFRIGNATNNIGWDSYQKISSHKSVAWAIPISLGDSHKGYRVMGTTQDYFKHYRFADDRGLDFEQGKHFDGVYDAVIGAEIAESLGYKIGDQLTLAHGVNDTGFSRHDDKPFILTGILARTGTPVDRTIHVSLEGIEALHIDWQSGTQSRNKVTAEQTLEMDLQPKQITAFMLGLKSKMEIFRIQRAINKYKKEPLLAVLPGLALGELWQLIGVAEKALLIIAVFVLLNSFVGLLTGILSS
ncbi:peptide ABC transporter permease, partial [Oleiphilus sp. HI0068]